ncbi:amino acid ABC transporter substrate-binding protein [Fructilactobacillus lindneri]|uniref:Amino acid ABC transporter substrate-binding component n=1 Tax=Fructilactobacillus lindneri DSM 20690 = JCM 11027 TaxID=1122148 RepID=A0A0R2JNV9_9LACO|nr:transporter substrate-binding domain-containing protein [Fructilactobacillus lindneri]ANZ57716.1 amino acid ABC transporter substrate-binding protein [Fructilactobacillus lindneri]KRN78848.1 amino acid ABC transporter substrate-binding component [Fructilactobacillus lindneri DSM 20690 = JCM 11027]POG98011.1 amino acid ABC transporter substrate-binding protein [Fructilactobacillus lindneri]POG99091.1 amino acid ABC transporter substrate-binding protein [Fructilactobacillus lindneri]POH01557.
MKKKLPLILMLGLITLVLAACGNQNSETKEKGTLTIGLEGTYPPYAYRQNGKLTGFEVELAKDTAKKMGLKPKFVTTGWDSLIQGINSQSYDVVFNNLAENPKRKKQFRFSKPYAYSKAIIITKKDSPIKNYKDLKGKKVAEGTGTDNWNNAVKLGAKPVASPEFQTSMDMIDDGRVQAAVNSKEDFVYWQKNHPKTDLTYQVIPSNVITPAAIAPMMNKNSKELNQKMNKALDEERRDGTMKRLSIKYFGTDITNK